MSETVVAPAATTRSRARSASPATPRSSLTTTSPRSMLSALGPWPTWPALWASPSRTTFSRAGLAGRGGQRVEGWRPPPGCAGAGPADRTRRTGPLADRGVAA